MAHPNSSTGTTAYIRKNQEAPLSLRSYILQGAIWIAVMLALFYTAGFRF